MGPPEPEDHLTGTPEASAGPPLTEASARPPQNTSIPSLSTTQPSNQNFVEKPKEARSFEELADKYNLQESAVRVLHHTLIDDQVKLVHRLRAAEITLARTAPVAKAQEVDNNKPTTIIFNSIYGENVQVNV
jgi:hypothetical protein